MIRSPGQLLFMFFWVISFGSFSQGIPSDSISLQHIKSGMSQNSVTQILEDRYGFLWVGTPNGINKFDGKRFQVFEKGADGESGLSNGYIENIYEDQEGNLYIGTNQGLNLYNRQLNLIKPYPFGEKGRHIQTKYIGAIYRNDDALWLGTEYDGVFRYSIESGESTTTTI